MGSETVEQEASPIQEYPVHYRPRRSRSNNPLVAVAYRPHPKSSLSPPQIAQQKRKEDHVPQRPRVHTPQRQQEHRRQQQEDARSTAAPSVPLPRATTAPVPTPDDRDALVTLNEAEHVYRRAVELFELSSHHPHHYDCPSPRHREEQQIAHFWQHNVQSRTAAALYISGSPGTGKSLTVRRVIQMMKEWERSEKKRDGSFARSLVVELNGMQIEGDDIEYKLLKALQLSPEKRLEESLAYKPVMRMTVIVLDELDQLIMRKQTDILRRLFDITTLPRSSLLFIGVANALQLRESLPHLKTAKYDAKVEQITFESYTKAQLLEILKQREQQLGKSIFDEQAMELCAAQAAKSSGDARKALYLAKLAIERVLKSLSRTWADQAKHPLPRVTVPTMMQTAQTALGESKRAAVICSLPFQQQVTLVCIALTKQQLGAASGLLSVEKATESELQFAAQRTRQLQRILVGQTAPTKQQ